jgi:D-alanyl-D-alanine carboxypeptidase
MHSGIPDWYGDEMEEIVASDRRRLWKPADVLALVGPGRAPAGEEFEYSDTNYTLLGLVIEQVRGRPVADVLRDGVLRIDGIERLVYQPDEAPTKPMAMPDGESTAALEKGGGYLPSLADASSAGPAGAIASGLAFPGALVAGVLRRRDRLPGLADRDDDVPRRVRTRVVRGR